MLPPAVVWGACDIPNVAFPPQTFLNPRYAASLGPIFIITLCTGLWAFVTAGGSFRSLLKCLSCKGGHRGAVSPFSCWGVGHGCRGTQSCRMGLVYPSPFLLSRGVLLRTPKHPPTPKPTLLTPPFLCAPQASRRTTAE